MRSLRVHDGYWLSLLLFGLAALVGSGVLISLYVTSEGTRDDGSAYHHAVYAFTSAILAAIGWLLTLPGLIGWGIHASGLGGQETED